MRIVIVGNGVAGMEAALAVRRIEPRSTITLVSEESDHFFSRTALMWVASGQLTHRDIEPYERDLYARMGFSRVRARAVGVDAEGHCLRLADGRDLPYDRLLLASGSVARAAAWPGSALRGVGAMVTLQDLEWLENEVHGGPSRGGRPPRPDAHLATSHPSSPYAAREVAARHRGRRPIAPVVVGGGLIGVEAVEVLLAAGLRPRLFARGAWLWPSALDPREARWVCDRLRAHGAVVHLDAEVDAFEGDADDNLVAVRAGDERFDADLAVVAIGVVPNTAWLADSGIELDPRTGGVIVDDALRTSAEDVLAAGDCAAVRWWDGTRRPEPLWYTARAQGRVAGRVLCGEDASYARGTVYDSAKVGDIEYTTVGRVGAGLPGETEWFNEERGPVHSTLRIAVADSAVVGMTLLGRRWDHEVLVRFVDERRSLDYVLDHLHEAAFDTELVPALRLSAEDRARPAVPIDEAAPAPRAESGQA